MGIDDDHDLYAFSDHLKPVLSNIVLGLKAPE